MVTGPVLPEPADELVPAFPEEVPPLLVPPALLVVPAMPVEPPVLLVLPATFAVVPPLPLGAPVLPALLVEPPSPLSRNGGVVADAEQPTIKHSRPRSERLCDIDS